MWDLLAFGVASGVITAAVANYKERDLTPWFITGLLLGIVGLAIIVCKPKIVR
jgi:hypothetical protein